VVRMETAAGPRRSRAKEDASGCFRRSLVTSHVTHSAKRNHRRAPFKVRNKTSKSRQECSLHTRTQNCGVCASEVEQNNEKSTEEQKAKNN
jgi:hypothetical protein